MTQTIDAIKKKYKNEWVLVDVVEEDKLNRTTKGRVLAHSKSREDIYDKMLKLPKGFNVAIFYTGEIPPKGTVFAF